MGRASKKARMLGPRLVEVPQRAMMISTLALISSLNAKSALKCVVFGAVRTYSRSPQMHGDYVFVSACETFLFLHVLISIENTISYYATGSIFCCILIYIIVDIYIQKDLSYLFCHFGEPVFVIWIH